MSEDMSENQLHYLRAFLFILLFSSGCFFQDCGTGATDLSPSHGTKLFVSFGGSPKPNGTTADPAPNEEVSVTVDGVFEGTATASQEFYMTIDTGKHTIVTKSKIVNSTYTTTHQFNSGDEFTFKFNCGDAQLTFNADAAWLAAGVTKLYIYTFDIFGISLGPTATLLPGESAGSEVKVRAGSIITVLDQNQKTIKQMPANVPYDFTGPFSITYP